MTRLTLAATFALIAGPAFAGELPPLVFSNTASPAHTIAARLLSDEAQEKIGGDYVSVAEIDLDLDGDLDMVAFAYANWFCGTAGCTPRVYLNTGRRNYKPIEIGLNDMTNSNDQFWSSSNELVNGHRVLHLEFEALTGDFVWQDGEYVRRD